MHSTCPVPFFLLRDENVMGGAPAVQAEVMRFRVPPREQDRAGIQEDLYGSTTNAFISMSSLVILLGGREKTQVELYYRSWTLFLFGSQIIPQG